MVEALLFDGLSAVVQPVLAEIDGASLRLSRPDAALIATWPIAAIRRSDPDVPGPASLLPHRRGPERLFVAGPVLLQRLRDGGARLGRRRAWGAGDRSGLAVALLGSIAIAALLVERLTSLAPPSCRMRWSAAGPPASRSLSRPVPAAARLRPDRRPSPR